MDDLIQQISNQILEARKEWCQKYLDNPENLKEKVQQTLSDNTNTILAKLLGFDTRGWSDKWEVDHCNGRSGESVVGDFIRHLVGEEIAKWLLEQTANLPNLSKAQTKALENEYLSRYKEELRIRLRALAEQKAKQDAEKMFSQVIALGKIGDMPTATREKVGAVSTNRSDD